jgi:retron-type reverse transcriptase
MTDLARVRQLGNLRLAWERIRSNPERKYKDYFRSQYTAFALADEEHLKELRRKLVRGIYQAQPACKILQPKPSGILRPITLLTIEDQIVYQAFANIVGEALHPHVRHRYKTQVFGHLFAGPTNTWFYKKWSEGYAAFNDAARDAFSHGYTWTASFDLTAFYDSIDHHVLRQMLASVGLEHEFCVTFTDMLEQWTATNTKIVHHHGIPQGPISSGIISEVVLKYFDDKQLTRPDVRYFRYVDDIRLFAKRENHLRQALVRLGKV